MDLAKMPEEVWRGRLLFCFLQVAQLESLTEFCQFGSGFIAVEAQEDRMTIEAQHEFASTLQLQEKFQDAEREQRDVLEKAKRSLTEDLWEATRPRLTMRKGRSQQPMHSCITCIAVSYPVFVPLQDHPVTLAAMQELALTLWQSRQLSEAQALYKEALPLYRNAQEDIGVGHGSN